MGPGVKCPPAAWVYGEWGWCASCEQTRTHTLCTHTACLRTTAHVPGALAMHCGPPGCPHTPGPCRCAPGHSDFRSSQFIFPATPWAGGVGPETFRGLVQGQQLQEEQIWTQSWVLTLARLWLHTRCCLRKSGGLVSVSFLFLFFLINLFLAVLGLRCCEWALPSCGERASHCGGSSCCRARALGAWASVVAARRL